MKKITLFFIFIFFVCSVLSAAAKPVKDPQTASALFYKSVGYMNRLGLYVRGKVQFFAVDDKTLDSLCGNSIYKGTELGLYIYKNGVHHIYAMYGIDPDRFMATCAHEYVHAWQAENCPHDQDDVVKEGFARWCEISALTYDGAYAEAQRYSMSADPVYGYGFKLLLAYQDKNGVNAMLELVKKIHNSSEIK